MRAVAGLVPVVLVGTETKISEYREVNMELNVKLDPMAYLPERAHPTDADGNG